MVLEVHHRVKTSVCVHRVGNAIVLIVVSDQQTIIFRRGK